MFGPAAFGYVTGNIDEFTFLPAFRTYIRRVIRGNQKSTCGTFPVGESAVWTNITDEFS
jgi:hypothetical protein